MTNTEYIVNIVYKYKDMISQAMSKTSRTQKQLNSQLMKTMPLYGDLASRATQSSSIVSSAMRSIGTHGKAVKTTFMRLRTELGGVVNKFKMLGLIGVGTIAALFMNTPTVAAGFELIKLALMQLFLAIDDYVLPAAQGLYDMIMKFVNFLRKHEALRKFIAKLVGVGLALSVLVVLAAAAGSILIVLFETIVRVGAAFKYFKKLIPFKKLKSLKKVLGGVSRLFNRVKKAISISKFRKLKTIFGGIISKIVRFITKGGKLVIKLGKIGSKVRGITKFVRILGKAFGVVFVLSIFKDFFDNLKKYGTSWKGIMISAVFAIGESFMGLLEIISLVMDKLTFGRLGIAEAFAGFRKLWESGKAGIADAIGLGSRRAGGFIPRTGMYKLHAGETVTPSGGTNVGDTSINISFDGASFSIANYSDIRVLARDIAYEVSREQKNILIGAGR